jgi:sugar/nucleoside kinase (ribokinase family)
MWFKQDGRVHDVPGINVPLVDSCGCGDTITAVLAMSMKEPFDEAVELANIAAAEVCSHPGVYAIQKEDLSKYYD